MSTLKDLIDWLESQPADAVVPHGFGCPMSFRGNYSEVAFEPADTAKISDMLHYAKYAMGNTFEGYKGGEFTMDERTACWISTYGESWRADRIGPTLLRMWEWAIKTQALKMEPLADHAQELRRHAEKVGRPAGDIPAVMHQAATYIEDLERRLREAESRVAELESELRDDHWPHGATVKLRWVGSGHCEKHGWAKRGAEGQLITVCSGVRLDESKWEVVQERKVQPARGEG